MPIERSEICGEKENPIPANLGQLERSINDLSARVDNLTKRLEPVLGPATPKTKPELTAVECGSTIGKYARDLHERIQAIIDMVEDIEHRLEL